MKNKLILAIKGPSLHCTNIKWSKKRTMVSLRNSNGIWFEKRLCQFTSGLILIPHGFDGVTLQYTMSYKITFKIELWKKHRIVQEI